MQDTVENLISDLREKKENIRNLEDVFVYYTKRGGKDGKYFGIYNKTRKVFGV